MRVTRNYFTALGVGLAAMSTVGCGDSARIATDPVGPNSGSLEVTVTTSGPELDTNGYGIAAVLAGGIPALASAPLNGTTILSGLSPGDYAVTLSDVAPNCDVLSPPMQTARVTNGNATKISFAIRCGAALEITFELGGGWDDDATPREFWTVSANGGVATQLTTDGHWHDSPAWSPDGSKLLFGSDAGGRFGVWMLDGLARAVALTKGAGEDFGARWSRDGTRIVFYGRTNGRLGIFTMNVDGSNRARIITGTSGQDLRADWSPDGKSFVFENKRDDGVWGIWTVRIDGTGLKQLTSSELGDYDPTWSPDGSKILFYRITPGGGHFYTITPAGSGLTRIASEYTPYGSPSWSPDGRKIAFTGRLCDNQCESGIHIVGLDGTRYTPALIADVVGDVAWRSRESQ